MKEIPCILKADIDNNPERTEQLVHEFVRLEFFRTYPEAKAFMNSLIKQRGYALRNEPRTAPVIDDHFHSILVQSWERVHAAYESTGRLNPAFAQPGLPGQLYDAAFQRASSFSSFDDALAAVCAENKAHLPQRIRAFENLSSVEPELKKAEERAAAALADARGKLRAARSAAVKIVNTRDRLTDNATRLKAELHELRAKRDLVAQRRERSAAHVVRTLRPGSVLMLHTIADLGASVFGFDIALAELARTIPEKEREVAAAEKELADFLVSNAEALAPV